MKNLRLQFLLIFHIISFSSLAQTIITIQFEKKFAGEERTFNLPVSNGHFLYLNSFNGRIDIEGRITLTLSLSAPGVVIMNYDTPLEFFVEPNSKLSVDIRNEPIQFAGSLSRENSILHSTSQKGIIMAMDTKYHPVLMRKMEKVETPELVFSMLDSLILSTESFSKKVSDDTSLSKDFVSYLNSDHRLYYYHMAFSVISNKISTYIYHPIAADSSIIKSTWGKALTKITTVLMKELRDNTAPMSQNYFYCMTDAVLKYHVWFLKENSFVTATDNPGRLIVDLFGVGIPTAMSQFLTSPMKEFFVPNILTFYLTGSVQFYSDEAIEMYNSYQEQFPGSVYLSVLKPKITEVKSIVGSSSKKKNKNVHILPNFELVNSASELFSHVQGKILYVDIWAMWCGPCIKEFESYGPLFKLKSKRDDFEILFISRDKIEMKQRWELFINRKELVGVHLIPNKSLEADLRAKINWTEIPRYLIIDRKGNIINADAPAPSDPKSLLLVEDYLNKEKK